jgi:hypothetical protein
VRAAEDNRTAPLPTLGEAIAAPFACTACGGFGMDHRCKESCQQCDGCGRAMFPKSVSASSAADHENKGVRMTKSDRQAADYRAEAIAAPFAEAAERSSTVSKTGGTQSGMRTERVTVEVTYDHGAQGHPRSWDWSTMVLDEGESVRVVEEELSDAWAQRLARLTAERDAAIRERDTLRAERITQALTADRFAAAVMEADTLRARVAELEADVNDCNIILGNRWRDAVSVVTGKAAPAASGGGEPVAWGFVTTDGAIVHVSTFEPEPGTATVIPLYRSPPQPRGWLTEDEREIIAGIADDDEYNEEGQNIAKALLARSSPPEVDLPISLSPIDEELVRASLAAAGVAVKEVGRE